MRPAPFPEPTWRVPRPYGYANALDSAGTFAAPLLVGFSITLIAFVVTTPGNVRWPNAALAVLAGATGLLFGSVQCAYNARLYVISPAEIEAWWPDANERQERWDQIRQEQRQASEAFLVWAARFRLCYHVGVLLIAAGVALILVPPGHHVGGRWIAIGIVLAGALLELAWVVGNWAKLLDAGKLTREQRRLERESPQSK